MRILLALVILLFSCNANNPTNQDSTPVAPTVHVKDDTMTKEDSLRFEKVKADAAEQYNSEHQTTNPELPSDPYEIMHTAFVGMPEKEEIKPMMERVMRQHSFEVNGNNALKFANALVTMRKESAVGVTEMDILKHMYQHGSPSNSLAEQVGISAQLLEQSK